MRCTFRVSVKRERVDEAVTLGREQALQLLRQRSGPPAKSRAGPPDRCASRSSLRSMYAGASAVPRATVISTGGPMTERHGARSAGVGGARPRPRLCALFQVPRRRRHARRARNLSGTNVENASYGLGFVRRALGLVGGGRGGRAANSPPIGIACIDAPAGCRPSERMPCGACRQWLMELAPDAAMAVLGVERRLTVRDLLPLAFAAQAQPTAMKDPPGRKSISPGRWCSIPIRKGPSRHEEDLRAGTASKAWRRSTTSSHCKAASPARR